MDQNTQILETLKILPLSEAEKASRHILGRLYGPIATAKDDTRNGRRYNRQLWQNQLADEIFQEKIANKALFLELGHPLDQRETTDMEKVCACIPTMPQIIDDDLYAYIDILDTKNGRLLKTLCDYGFVPGISSRGTGDIMANDEVDPETFFLETWDIVQLPAVKKARLKVYESVDPTQLRLKAALLESYKAADEIDKKNIKEALDKLAISLDLPEATKDIIYEDPNTPDDLLTEDEKEDDVEMIDGEKILLEDEVKEEEPAETEPFEIGEAEEAQKTVVEFTPDEVKEVALEVAKEVLPPTETEEEETAQQEDLLHLIDDVVEDAVEEKLELAEDEEEVNADEAEAIKDEQPETVEVPGEDKEAESIVEPVEQVEETSEDADDDGAEDAFVENLKELIRQKGLLEGEIKALKAEKAVNNVEVEKLKEELNKYRTGFARVSELAAKSTKFEKDVKGLSEQIALKDKQLNKLQAQAASNTKLTESVNAQEQKVKFLTEKLDVMQKDLTTKDTKLTEQTSQYKEKLTEAVKVAKAYKTKFASVLNHYIESRASMLGVKPAEITNRLNEDYSVENVDRVCDELLESTIRLSSLTVGFDKKSRIKVNDGKPTSKVTPEAGYEINDDLLILAGLK